MDVLKSALAQRGKIHHFKERGIIPPEPASESLVHGELTLGELYFELLTIKNNNDPNISRFVNSEGVIYPNIVIPQEIPYIKPPQAISVRGTSGGLLTSFQRLFGNTGSQFDGQRYGKKVVRDDRRPKDDQEEPAYKYYLRSALDFVLRSFNLKHEPLFHLIPDSLRLSVTAPANLFAWHPYQQKLAVALRNDHIRIYDLNLQAWSSLALSHEFQRDISCMQWKPLSGNTLAVGCRYGVCVWSIVSKKVQRPNIAIKEGDNDANANSYQEQSAWMTYLNYPGHAPVNCLAWSPCENLLAAGSVSSHRVVVWDTALDQPIPLNEITLGAGITMLKWSPNGHYLFAATTKSTFHVWETKTWRCEKWSNLKTYVQTAAWSSDSRYLAIAASGDSSIHFIEFPSHPPQIAAQYIGTEDVGPYSVTLGSGREVTVGGNIKELAWDMTGQRLVVSFMDNNQAKKDNSDRAHAGAGLEAVKKRLFTEEDGENSAGTGEYSDTCHSLFALFATRSTPVVNLEPMGFIRGPPSSSSPLQISFRPNFPKGALLTAVWASGKISFFPLYFKTD